MYLATASLCRKYSLKNLVLINGSNRDLVKLHVLLNVFFLVMAIYNLSHNLLNSSCGHEHVTRNFLKNGLHP